jgi:hypothetical protein
MPNVVAFNRSQGPKASAESTHRPSAQRRRNSTAHASLVSMKFAEVSGSIAIAMSQITQLGDLLDDSSHIAVLQAEQRNLAEVWCGIQRLALTKADPNDIEFDEQVSG